MTLALGGLRTGCVPDVLDGSELLFRDQLFIGETPITTDSVDVRAYMPEVRLQLAENCCAQAVRDSAYGRAKAQGTPIAEPSQAWLYALARMFGAPHVPLLDAGSSLFDMFRAVDDRSIGLVSDTSAPGGWGLIPDALWPEDATTTNMVPPDDCWRAGEFATIQAAYAIADGAGSTDEIVTALRNLRFPTVCLIADEKFAETGAAVYDSAGGKIIGAHCVLAVGYSKVLDAVLIRNSWGSDFGFDGGYAWISRSFVNLQSFGKWAVDVAPAQLRAA